MKGISTNAEKAMAIIKAIGRRVADGQRVVIAPDWGFGTASIFFEDGSHVHVGNNCEDEAKSLQELIDGMFGLVSVGAL